MSTGKRVFGSTLSENVRRYGNPIPPTILRAMQHLHDNGEKHTSRHRHCLGRARFVVDNRYCMKWEARACTAHVATGTGHVASVELCTFPWKLRDSCYYEIPDIPL